MAIGEKNIRLEHRFLVEPPELFRPLAQELIESKGGAIGWREFVDEGGLMSNAANLPELCRQSARRVNKILKGSKPGDMPFDVPTRYELIVNLKMTKAIRLNFSDSFLVLADEVIQ